MAPLTSFWSNSGGAIYFPKQKMLKTTPAELNWKAYTSGGDEFPLLK